MVEVVGFNHQLFKTRQDQQSEYIQRDDLDYFFNNSILQKVDIDLNDSLGNLNVIQDDSLEIIHDNFDWDNNSDCREWKIKLISSLFISKKSYFSEDKLIEWANKYLFGYCLLLVSTSVCWNNFTARLYFDGLDVERLKKLDIFIRALNDNKLYFFYGIHITKFINSDNIKLIYKKVTIIMKNLKDLINIKIQNDYDFIKYLFVLCTSINNNLTINLNRFELITYNFTVGSNINLRTGKIIDLKYPYSLFYDIEKQTDGLFKDKYELYHSGGGYLGQILRCIGLRDKLIDSNTLILFRDGHATSPSIYENETLCDFIKNQEKKIRIGHNLHYREVWHKTIKDNYKKGIYMGYITCKQNKKNNCPLSDDLYYKSWGKLFSITPDIININLNISRILQIEAINDRYENKRMNEFNYGINKPDIDLFTYGLDEYLGCQLGYDDNTKVIDWHNLIWLESILNSTQFKNKYQFIHYTIIFLFKLLFDFFNRNKTEHINVNSITINEFIFFLNKLIKQINNNQEIIKLINLTYPTYFIKILSLIPTINNNVYYLLNTLLDSSVNLKVNGYINRVLEEGDYEAILKSLNDNNLKLKQLYFNEKVKYDFKYVVDEAPSELVDYVFGLGWQDKVFKDHDHFDYLKVPLVIKINKEQLEQEILQQEQQVQNGGANKDKDKDKDKYIELDLDHYINLYLIGLIGDKRFDDITFLTNLLTEINRPTNINMQELQRKIRNLILKKYK